MADGIYIKTFSAVALAGAACGLTGVFVFLLNIPFVGVAIAHSAMAGGIWGVILGLPSKLSAFMLSLAASFFIGPVADRSKINPNISLSIIFSVAMGIAFLGVGLMAGDSRPVMSFLWGNIFLIDSGDLMLMTGLLFLMVLVIVMFYRQYLAILFNREIAASAGVNEKFFYYMLLVLIGGVITVNLSVIGGLMLFSFIIMPPAIAYQLTYDLKKFFVLSAVSGAAGGCGGVFLSFLLNWPVSASVVLFTSMLFIAVVFVSPKKKKYRQR